MKYIFLIISVFAFSISDKTDETTWNEIQNKTWVSSSVGPMGAHLVFLQDKIGKKAAVEFGGSGCCRIYTIVLEVEVVADTINLFSIDDSTGLFLNGKMKFSTFVFSRQLRLLYDKANNCTYGIQFDIPILHKFCCTKVDIEQLKSDTIRSLDFSYPINNEPLKKVVKRNYIHRFDNSINLLTKENF